MNQYTTLSQIQSDINLGKTSCVYLVNGYLAAIDKDNEILNAFLEVYAKEAKLKAVEVDHKIKSGVAGRLAGLVVGIKDVISHKEHGLQASSKMLDKFVAQYNATVIDRLLAEDAIIIGRQNCDEFAMGSTNESSAFGPTKNGIDISRVPGGSSGGSAVGIQAGMCHVSLGSDTGGSVRQPASFCGIVGLKPTYSRISRFGLIAYASSFDSIGIFGHSVEDVALVLEIIAGKDDFDSTVSQKEVPNYSQNLGFDKKLKIGYLRQSIDINGVQPDVVEMMKASISNLEADGHTVEPVEFPLLDYALPTYYILTTAEASSNLSRFDGVRYGYRSPSTTDLSSMYKKSRSEGFGKEVKRRIMLGTFVLSASYYDAYFTKAQKVRRLIREGYDALFAKYDYLILPTNPMTAFKFGEFNNNPLAMYLADVFTVSANIVGIPAISIPISKDNKNLPMGLQIMARNFDEAGLLAFSNYIMTYNRDLELNTLDN